MGLVEQMKISFRRRSRESSVTERRPVVPVNTDNADCCYKVLRDDDTAVVRENYPSVLPDTPPVAIPTSPESYADMHEAFSIRSRQDKTLATLFAAIESGEIEVDARLIVDIAAELREEVNEVFLDKRQIDATAKPTLDNALDFLLERYRIGNSATIDLQDYCKQELRYDDLQKEYREDLLLVLNLFVDISCYLREESENASVLGSVTTISGAYSLPGRYGIGFFASGSVGGSLPIQHSKEYYCDCNPLARIKGSASWPGIFSDDVTAGIVGPIAYSPTDNIRLPSSYIAGS